MNDVTQILSRIEAGDPTAAEQLLPLVYDELRKLAAQKLVHEKPGQTLQATALVHEAYLRLLGPAGVEKQWNSRAHFFAAAAEAMRRILVDNARRKQTIKHGGGRQRVEFDGLELTIENQGDDILALHDALTKLQIKDPRKAELVKLRFFAGLSNQQAAQVLGISSTTADNDWAYARSWLQLEVADDNTSGHS